MSDYEVEEDDELKKFMPTSFGKQSRVANTAAQVDQSKRKVNVSEKLIKAEDEDDKEGAEDDREEDDDDDDDSDDEDDEDEYPVSHELIIKTHDRAVTTATLDPSGNRLITGSMDCTLKLHDFSSMTPTTIRAFRSVDPTASKASANVETHPIHQVLFNPLSPSQILVITAMPQAKIFTRDGELQTTFVKGDMYLRDMHNTKGHISELTCGAWHPTSKEICVTAGTDSTLRIWDVTNARSQKDIIVHKSRAAGSAGRTRMTAVAYGNSPSGGSSMIYGAAFDGSIACWSASGPFIRPSGEIRDAHVKDTWISGLDVSSDGRTVVTRGGDDTIKTWDTRKFKHPVTVMEHPSTSSHYPTSNICFSPNSSSILTGSATGHLHILNPATLKPELVTPVTPGSPLITVLWHEKLNQIITGSANAETHVLYNPNTSTGGAKMVMLKAPKRRHIDDDPNLTTDLSLGLSGDATANPGSGQSATSWAARHPGVGMTVSGKPRDPRRPHIPATTPFAKSQPDERHVRENIPLSSLRDEDPRAALLKYQDKAESDPMFTNAWKLTQPKTIYREVSDDEEEASGPDKKKFKR